jgi:hypothetical protein
VIFDYDNSHISDTSGRAATAQAPFLPSRFFHNSRTNRPVGVFPRVWPEPHAICQQLDARHRRRCARRLCRSNAPHRSQRRSRDAASVRLVLIPTGYTLQPQGGRAAPRGGFRTHPPGGRPFLARGWLCSEKTGGTLVPFQPSYPDWSSLPCAS